MLPIFCTPELKLIPNLAIKRKKLVISLNLLEIDAIKIIHIG